MSAIDISIPFVENMPAWPGSPGFHAEKYKSIQRGDRSNDTCMTMDVHVGTHVETSLHTSAEGVPIETLMWEHMYGPVLVADVRGCALVTADVLEQRVGNVSFDRLLLKTDNADCLIRPDHVFDQSFVGLSVDGAQWVADHGCLIVGNDYLSIAAYGLGHDVHNILFERGVAILEGVHLSHVDPGTYTLVCATLCMPGSEAAPARAFLITL